MTVSRSESAEGSRTTPIKAEITKALAGLKYGQLVIVIKGGKMVQLDRTEKRRLPPIEGIDGEGI